MIMMSKGRPRPIEIIIMTREENLSSGGVPYPIMKVLQNLKRNILLIQEIIYRELDLMTRHKIFKMRKLMTHHVK